MKKLIAILLACLMVLSMAACGSNSASTDAATADAAEVTEAAEAAATDAETESTGSNLVKVAVMCPMSGDSAQFYDQYRSAIDAAMKIVDEDNMLKDYELEFEYIDDKGTTDGAPTAATYALDQYGCNVSIGHLLTTMILADGQYFEDAETPLIGIVSGPASVSQGWNYLCIATGTDLVQGDTVVDYLVGYLGYKNISLVNINTEGGITAATEIERYLKEQYGLDLATHDVMSNEDSDYTSVAMRMKDAGTDCVIFWGLSQASGQLCYTAVKTYCPDAAFAGGTNLAQNQMLTTWNAEDIDGVVFPVGYIPDETNALQPRATQYYTENMEEYTGTAIALTDVPARVFDAVLHIVTALNDMGLQDTESDTFNQNLAVAMRNASFDGIQGHFDFSANDNGVGLTSMNIGVWDSEYNQSKVQWSLD